jgi:hypothetical protein
MSFPPPHASLTLLSSSSWRCHPNFARRRPRLPQPHYHLPPGLAVICLASSSPGHYYSCHVAYLTPPIVVHSSPTLLLSARLWHHSHHASRHPDLARHLPSLAVIHPVMLSSPPPRHLPQPHNRSRTIPTSPNIISADLAFLCYLVIPTSHTPPLHKWDVITLSINTVSKVIMCCCLRMNLSMTYDGHKRRLKISLYFRVHISIMKTNYLYNRTNYFLL